MFSNGSFRSLVFLVPFSNAYASAVYAKRLQLAEAVLIIMEAIMAPGGARSLTLRGPHEPKMGPRLAKRVLDAALLLHMLLATLHNPSLHLRAFKS